MIDVHRLKPTERDPWCQMRIALWPPLSAAESAKEMTEILARPAENAVFIATDDQLGPVGFVEASLKDWAPGCTTRPVGYIEGWYVKSAARRHGVGRALIAAAEDWARSLGCREMASDTELYNTTSQVAHARLGYAEVERVVHFRKPL